MNLPALKRFVTDCFPDYKLPQPAVPERPEKIAIVGSGPAGLLCAYELRQKGYGATIFEALPVAGGMLAVGIPSFRLPRPLLNAELDRLRSIGIEILLNTPVGRAITLRRVAEELRRRICRHRRSRRTQTRHSRRGPAGRHRRRGVPARAVQPGRPASAGPAACWWWAAATPLSTRRARPCAAERPR